MLSCEGPQCSVCLGSTKHRWGEMRRVGDGVKTGGGRRTREVGGPVEAGER